MEPIDFTKKRTDKLLGQNAPLGGTVLIKFDGTDFAVGAPLHHVYEAFDLLKSKNRQTRKAMMKSVTNYIKTMLPRVEKGEASMEKVLNISQDITIWFANEVFEGRKSFDELEQYNEQTLTEEREG